MIPNMRMGAGFDMIDESTDHRGTVCGALLNELIRSPETTLVPLVEMLRYVTELSHSSVHSTCASFILFMISVASTLEVFLCDAVSSPALRDFLESEIGPISDALSTALHQIRVLMGDHIRPLLDGWLFEAEEEVAVGTRLKSNVPTMVRLSYCLDHNN